MIIWVTVRYRRQVKLENKHLRFQLKKDTVLFPVKVSEINTFVGLF